MKDLKLSITINVSAEALFDFTLNPSNTPKWVDFVAVEETNEWPPKLGTVYRNRGYGNAGWSEFEMTEYEPPKSFTFSKRDGSYHVRYILTPMKSEVTKLDYYEWTDGDELAVPFTMEPLQKLKRLLESAA